MINPQKLVDQISIARNRLDNEVLKTRESNNIKKNIQFLTLVVRYLESDPSPSFIKKELEKINNRIMLINRDFTSWIPQQYYEDDKTKLKAYQKIMGLKELKAKVRVLRFIVNK